MADYEIVQSLSNVGAVYAAASSHDSKLVFVGGDDKLISKRDWRSGEVVKTSSPGGFPCSIVVGDDIVVLNEYWRSVVKVLNSETLKLQQTLEHDDGGYG